MGTVANPVSLTFDEWAMALVNDNGIDLPPPPEEDWREWGQQLRDAIPMGALLPDPDDYVDWQGWVEDSFVIFEEM
jgi:hypothetical protein